MMRPLPILTALLALALPFQLAHGTQADDTTVTISGDNPGVTPFISQLTLLASDTSVLKSIQFTITPKSGSHTRPLSATYSSDYLISRGYLQAGADQIFLPIYGLYDGYSNNVTLTYFFTDGSSKQDATTITTTVFSDPCGYKNPTILQARTDTTSLSYDYILVKGACSEFSPAIIDTDGALRWVGPGGITSYSATFFDNAIYISKDNSLYRIDLDGTVTLLHSYGDIGVTYLHHNIDRGKVGVILDVDTTSDLEAVNIEVDATGAVIKTWNLADIISAAMIAGGDDPSQFVYPTPTDWFHNNAAAYNQADDSIVVSSRENFLIDLDYESGAIKWILGDPTKKWHEFPSLAAYALTLPPGSLPPIGQHAPSITYDQGLLVFDNGALSLFQDPPGANRMYASPRKYRLDLMAKTATEVWNYPMNESVFSPYCGSVYEDAPFNYLIDYALVNGAAAENVYAQLLGLDAAGEKVFYYQYPTYFCNTAFSSIPLHLESTKFPTVGPQALNLSTRGQISSDDHTLIAGFIVNGTDSKKVALRVLGPSLTGSTLTDPALTLYDASGTVIATNDDWQTDPGSAEIATDGLAPSNSSESATVQALAPGAYTMVASSQNSDTGLGLVEAYDLSPESNSQMANISTRGFVGLGDEALISGFIVGDVASDAVVIRALGPSLAAFNLGDPLSDPTLTIFDTNGTVIATNDNWQDDVSRLDIQANGLAPSNGAESATALYLPAGAYTAIENGSNDSTGIGLIEVYDLTSSP